MVFAPDFGSAQQRRRDQDKPKAATLAKAKPDATGFTSHTSTGQRGRIKNGKAGQEVI